MAQSVVGLVITLRFYMKILWDQSTVSANRFYNNDTENIGRKLATYFGKILGLKKAGCSLCSEELFMDVQDDPVSPVPGLAVYANFRTTTNCQPDFILDRATTFFGQQLNARISKKETIVVLVNIETRYPEEWNKQKIFARQPRLPCYPVYVLDTVSICPKIEVRSSEVIQLRNEEQKRTFLGLFENGDYERNKSINICWDIYVSALVRESRATYIDSNNLLLGAIIFALQLVEKMLRFPIMR